MTRLQPCPAVSLNAATTIIPIARIHTHLETTGNSFTIFAAKYPIAILVVANNQRTLYSPSGDPLDPAQTPGLQRVLDTLR